MISFTIVLSWNVIPRLWLSDRCVVPVACVEVQAVAPTLKQLVSFEKNLFARKVKGIYGPRILVLQVRQVKNSVSIMNMTVMIPHRRCRQVTVFWCMRLVTLCTCGAFLLLCPTVWQNV